MLLELMGDTGRYHKLQKNNSRRNFCSEWKSVLEVWVEKRIMCKGNKKCPTGKGKYSEIPAFSSSQDYGIV